MSISGIQDSLNRIAGTTGLATQAAADSAADSVERFGGLAGVVTSVPRKGAVCFTFDDGTVDHYTIVRPILNAAGMKGTFSVNGAKFDVTNFMTSAQIRQLYAEGHEIANHSYDHTDLSSLSVANRVLQYNQSQTALDALIGAGNYSTFTYPYGGRTATIDSEMHLRYDRVLDIQPGAFYRDPTEPNFILRRHNWKVSNHTQTLNLIRQAASSHSTLILMVHQIDAVDGSSPTTAQFQEGVTLASSLGLIGARVDQAFPTGRLTDAGGFEDTTLSRWTFYGNGASNAVPTGTIYESIVDTPASGMPGTNSLHLKTTADTDVVWARLNQFVEIRPNVNHGMSCRARVTTGSGAGTVNIRVIEYRQDITGTTVTNTSSAITSTTWTSASTSFTANQNTRWGYLEVGINGRNCEAWFDHIDFRPVSLGSFG